jgi:hypothetical protein
VKAAELPPALQNLTPDQRRAVVKEKTEERARIQARLQELEKDRKAYLAQIRRAERRRTPSTP